MSKRAEQKALEEYPPSYSSDKRHAKRVQSVSVDTRQSVRTVFQKGYEQAEKDILSKITTEHINGLKWIEKTGITSQPYPYHKYCKDLRITLEKLLSDE